MVYTVPEQAVEAEREPGADPAGEAQNRGESWKGGG